jgi:hypothetical protein
MYSMRVSHRGADSDPSVSLKARKTRRSMDLVGWIVVAWVAWWSWAYVQSAVLHRFPQLRIGVWVMKSSEPHDR